MTTRHSFHLTIDDRSRQMSAPSSSSSPCASRLARASFRVEYTAASKALAARESREETSREEEDADAACVLRLDVVDDVRGRATVECELGLEGARKLDDALREASARVEALARVSGDDARA